MAQINGTSSADVLVGTSASDVFVGAAGHDTFVFTVGGASQADVINDFGGVYFAASITGGQETPPVASAASGTASGYLNRSQTEFNFTATVTGLDLGATTPSTADNVTASHFHRAPAGTAGGVVFGFIGAPNNEVSGETVVNAATGTVTGSWDAGEGNAGNTLASLTPALLNNEIYINFHTQPFPAGEIRGQMLVQDQGLDRVDVSQLGVGDFGQLQSLMTEVNGSTLISFQSNGQMNTLLLNGASMARLGAGDFVFAGSAARTLFGSQGADDLFGSSGADILFGEGGNDRINSGAGNDNVEGRDGADTIQGMDGNDGISGGDGSDDVNGNAGNDTVHGDEGVDVVRGGQDNDMVFGDAGDDSHVNGNRGDDQVFGGDGNDTVYGGQGNDTVRGEAGNDHVYGDLGADILYGGAGADRFVLRAGFGADWVGDFSFAEGDRIQLATGSTYTMTSYQGQVLITLSTGDTLGLAGVASTGFTSDWVVFA